MNDQKKRFYKRGIEALKSRWQKCVDIEVDLILKNKFLRKISYVHVKLTTYYSALVYCINVLVRRGKL